MSEISYHDSLLHVHVISLHNKYNTIRLGIYASHPSVSMTNFWKTTLRYYVKF
jgi:hypothetical protein